MEFEAAVVKCPKCSESLSLFFQKGAQGAPDAEVKTKINEVIKTLTQLVRESEDREARIARIEDFLQGSNQQQADLQVPLPPQGMRR